MHHPKEGVVRIAGSASAVNGALIHLVKRAIGLKAGHKIWVGNVQTTKRDSINLSVSNTGLSLVCGVAVATNQRARVIVSRQRGLSIPVDGMRIA